VSQTQLRSVTASEARIIYKKTELFDKEWPKTSWFNQ
jgi:hypothetical protein